MYSILFSKELKLFFFEKTENFIPHNRYWVVLKNDLQTIEDCEIVCKQIIKNTEDMSDLIDSFIPLSISKRYEPLETHFSMNTEDYKNFIDYTVHKYLNTMFIDFTNYVKKEVLEGKQFTTEQVIDKLSQYFSNYKI